MSTLSHPSIMTQRGFFQDETCLCIVFDLMSTDVRGLLSELDIQLPESIIKKIFHRTVEDVAFCH